MTRCPYRADKECKHIGAEDPDCYFCLMGQQADELSLINSAIANLTASLEEQKAEKIMEAVHKEEYE